MLHLQSSSIFNCSPQPDTSLDSLSCGSYDAIRKGELHIEIAPLGKVRDGMICVEDLKVVLIQNQGLRHFSLKMIANLSQPRMWR